MKARDVRRVAGALRRLLPVWSRPRPWRSVHPAWQDVPVAGPGYAGAGWAEATLGSTRAVVQSLRSDRAAALNVAEHLYLPILASLLVAERGRVRIVDVGGSLGVAFQYVKALVPPSAVEYHVVETAETLELAAAHPELTEGIAFHKAFPAVVPDIVHLGSVLQYIEDYAGFLQSVADRKPLYILFVNTPFVDAATVAAAQVNIRDSVIAYWFLELAEIERLLGRSSYERVFTIPADRLYDTRNLPEPYCHVAQLHVLFRLREG